MKQQEHGTRLYRQWQAKHAALAKAKARLSALSSSADGIRARASAAVAAAQAAQGKAVRTQTTNNLLLNSERRLRIKQKVFAKEAKAKAAAAHKWAGQVRKWQDEIHGNKAKLKEETLRGESYLEQALSGQQQRKQIEARVLAEKQAFNNEAALREADAEQLNKANTQLAAAQAVVDSLHQQETLAAARAWKADMRVMQARQQQQLEEQVAVSSCFPEFKVRSPVSVCPKP